MQVYQVILVTIVFRNAIAHVTFARTQNQFRKWSIALELVLFFNLL